jgi:intracellular sulfur oxidation DsrE/DsrF family protein
MSKVDRGPTPLQTSWTLQLVFFLNDLVMLVAWVDGVRLLQRELPRLLRALQPRVEFVIVAVVLIRAQVSRAPGWLVFFNIVASSVVEVWKVR